MKTLPFFLLLLGVFGVFAQKPHLFCQFKEVYTLDSLNRNVKNADLMALEIDEVQSKYYSINYLNRLIAMEKQYNNQGSIDLRKISIPKGKNTVIHHQVLANIFSTFQQLGSNKYTFDEPNPVFDWAISTDTMTIAKHLCQKATTTFRGRNYTAWFAQDISLPYGPWKFGGLPGLILAIEDSKKDYSFSCIEVSKVEVETVLIDKEIENKKNFQKMTKKEFNQLYLVYLQDPMQFFAKGAITMTSPVANPQKKPYNPIELTE